MMDYLKAYQLLGVKTGATAIEIRQAWRKACMKHHPDRGGNQTDFLEAKEAFKVALTHCNSQTCLSCNGTGKVWKTFGISRMHIRCLCTFQGVKLR